MDTESAGSAPYTPQHIANFFLYRAEQEGIKDITPMKLIKLVYIAYAWYLALYNKPLFDECIEPWQHGPVVPSIYHEFKKFRANPITEFANNFDLENQTTQYPIIDNKDEESLSVLKSVWDCYKNHSGAQLRNITHVEDSAWSKARRNVCDVNDYPQEIKQRALQAISSFIQSNRRGILEKNGQEALEGGG